MSKITLQEEADFVITMMERDVGCRRDSEDKLTYLKIIGDRIDEMGDKIIMDMKKPKLETPIGEDRPPIGDDAFELALISPNDGPLNEVVNDIMKLSRPKRYRDCMTPLEFVKAHRCYKGNRAHEWLKKNNFTHEYDHLHVHNDRYCMVLEDGAQEVAWIRPGGVQIEGDVIKVLKAMFHQYLEDAVHG